MAAGIPSGVYGHPTHVSRETVAMVPFACLCVLTAVSYPFGCQPARSAPFRTGAWRPERQTRVPIRERNPGKGDVGGGEVSARAAHAGGSRRGPSAVSGQMRMGSPRSTLSHGHRVPGGRGSRETPPFHVKHPSSCSEGPSTGREFRWRSLPQVSRRTRTVRPSVIERHSQRLEWNAAPKGVDVSRETIREDVIERIVRDGYTACAGTR